MGEILKNKKNISYSVVLLTIFLVIIILFLPKVFRVHYFREGISNLIFATSTPKEKVFIPIYVDTPEKVKGIYMTSWVASNHSLRDSLVKLIDETEVNTVVIDIKDYSGKIVFAVGSTELKSFGSEEVRVPDLPEFIDLLHKKGVYVVGRIAVFQDEYFVRHRPDLAVKNASGTDIWKDRKGISWIDAGAREYWKYIILLSKEARKIGFDELNFDYIRFPSDGNMANISYPFSSTTSKTIVLKNFFQYLDNELAEVGVKTSADLFGMTTTAKDDMGIGQILEDALPYFDYVMPMVYPSHYPPNFQNFTEPEKYPYEVVKFTMQSAVDRAELLSSTTGKTVAELRPWLQDFGLRTTYGSKEVRDQIRATNDVGLTSWILWSPSNKYTKGALNTD